MRKTVTANRDQVLLFKSTIEENLPKDHEIYLFARLIDNLDMSDFDKKYSHKGGKIYDPKVILSILLYGYHRGRRSSRKLARACNENLAMRYLIGGLQVKFRAIADFRIRFDKEIADVFRQSVGQVVSYKPSVGDDVKTDGTKVASYAANDQTYTKAKLKEMQQQLEQQFKKYLEGGIKDDLHEDKLFGKDNSSGIDIEQSQKVIDKIIQEQKKQAKKRAQEDDRQAIKESSLIKTKPSSSAKLTKEDDHIHNLSTKETGKDSKDSIEENTQEKQKPETEDISTAEEFQHKIQKLEKIKRALEVAKDEPDDSKINLTDPESRFMKNKGRITQSYNIQATSSEGYLVDIDIADNNACNDQHELPSSLTRTEENTGKCPKESSSDAGYFHELSLDYLDKNGIEGYIPSPRETGRERKQEPQTGYEAHNFQYDPIKNSYTCPQGKPLPLESTRSKKGKNTYIFRCQPIHCVGCPVRETCCSNKQDYKLGRRSLELGEAHALQHAMILKMQTEEGKAKYKKRGAEIEPIFGTWKAARNFRQLLLRGKKKVRVEAKLIATAFNFGKLIRQGLVSV